MHTTEDYLDIIEPRISDPGLPPSPAGLYQPIVYALSCGGKRLRPILTLASAEAFCGDPMRAINQALAVEMFHNFTLLHDDVMDRADMRRGKPTVHRRWNERTAILSGDAMLTYSNILLCRGTTADTLPKLLEMMNKTAMEVYEGQQLDMDFEQRTDVTTGEYIEMIRLKTSVLLGCACALGAIAGGASEDALRAMYGYGEKLGLAFQLQDDYLDTFGDPLVFGKEIGGDILNDKKTWLLITALAEDKDGILRHEIESPSAPAEKIERVRKVYTALELPARCHRLIDTYVDEAIASLDNAGITPAARDFFAAIADKSRTRTH